MMSGSSGAAAACAVRAATRQLRMIDAFEFVYTCGLVWVRMSDSLLMAVVFQVLF